MKTKLSMLASLVALAITTSALAQDEFHSVGGSSSSGASGGGDGYNSDGNRDGPDGSGGTVGHSDNCHGRAGEQYAPNSVHVSSTAEALREQAANEIMDCVGCGDGTWLCRRMQNGSGDPVIAQGLPADEFNPTGSGPMLHGGIGRDADGQSRPTDGYPDYPVFHPSTRQNQPTATRPPGQQQRPTTAPTVPSRPIRARTSVLADPNCFQKGQKLFTDPQHGFSPVTVTVCLGAHPEGRIFTGDMRFAPHEQHDSRIEGYIQKGTFFVTYIFGGPVRGPFGKGSPINLVSTR